MNKINAFVALFLVLLIAIGINTYISLHDHNQVQGLTKKIAITTRESAITRVTTVEQRCELTKLLANSIPVPSAKPKLLSSYGKCLKQLDLVKKIAAEAP